MSETTKTTKATNGEHKIRKPQLRMLEVLAKSKERVPEADLQEKSKVDPGWVADSLYGRIGDLPVKANLDIKTVTPLGKARGELKGPSLLMLGYVRGKVIDSDGKFERQWEITGTGKKALENASK